MSWKRPRGIFAIWENMVLAFQTLYDRKFRSLLTVLGVSIGVIIIIGVAAVLNGFRQRVIDATEQFGTSNIYVSRFPMVRMGRPDRSMRRRPRFFLPDAWAMRDECPAVETVSPYRTEGTNMVKHETREMMGAILQGGYAELRDVMNITLSEGRFFSSEENRRAVRVCAIGATVARTLFPTESPIGKRINVDGTSLSVIGVMDPFKSAFGGDPPQDSMIMVPYTVFRQIYPWERGIDIVVRAKPGRMREALDQVEELARRRRHISWFEPNDFEVNTSESITAAFDKVVFATLAVMFALSTVAFMVGGVGVMNVMLASVKERTREIGVRRAIGARRRDIVWQFLTEAMAMTGLGGLLGVALGEGLMTGLTSLVPAMPCAIPMWARLFGIAGSVAIGLVFGLWPAVAAARLDPIKALRYE